MRRLVPKKRTGLGFGVRPVCVQVSAVTLDVFGSFPVHFRLHDYTVQRRPTYGEPSGFETDYSPLIVSGRFLETCWSSEVSLHRGKCEYLE